MPLIKHDRRATSGTQQIVKAITNVQETTTHVQPAERALTATLADAAVTVAAHARTSTAQSIANAAADVIVVYGTEISDTHNALAAGVFTVPLAGSYAVAALATLASAAWAAGGVAELSLYLNGVRIVVLDRQTVTTAATLLVELTGMAVGIPCIVGDTFDVRISQSSGGAIALQNSTAYNHCGLHRI